MFEVKVTFEAGESLKSLLAGLANPAVAINPVAANPVTAIEVSKPMAGPSKEEPAPKPEAPKADTAEKPTRTRRTKEQIAAEEAQTANGWGDMDDDAKLEAIKAEVTKHAKKGKSADIKFLLSNFDAGRASELDPKDYDAFFDTITRYGKGESVEKIFPGDEELN